VASASCPVRDLSSTRVDQSASRPVRELVIYKLSSNRYSDDSTRHEKSRLQAVAGPAGCITWCTGRSCPAAGRGVYQRRLQHGVKVAVGGHRRRQAATRSVDGNVRMSAAAVDLVHSLDTPGVHHLTASLASRWWRGPAVERRSLADVLSLSCARHVADG